MYKLIRIINQNRRQILIAILAIVFVIVIIQILNSEASKSREEKIAEAQNIIENNKYNTSTHKPSQSIVSGDTLGESVHNSAEEVIDNFINSCNNGQVEQAYNLLSKECKEELYPSLEKFKQSYYAKNFKVARMYSIQLWSSVPIIYKVELYEDMLATGKGNTDISIQDFFTVVKENDERKLNISGYIGKREINKQATKSDITIKVNYKNIYKDYEIYNITVENLSENDIMLNSGESTKTVYLDAANSIEYEANIFDIDESFINVSAYSKNTIEIKFIKEYLASSNVQALVFEDIILNADEYKQTQSKRKYENRLNLKVEIAE